MKLSDVTGIFCGRRQVSAVYIGSRCVWQIGEYVRVIPVEVQWMLESNDWTVVYDSFSNTYVKVSIDKDV